MQPAARACAARTCPAGYVAQAPERPAAAAACREGFPEVGAPANLTEERPFVDLQAIAYDMLADPSAPWQPDVQSLLTFVSRFMQLGGCWAGAGGGRREGTPAHPG